MKREREKKATMSEMSFYLACHEGRSFAFDKHYDQTFPHYKMKPHSHPSVELLYVTSGEVLITVDMPEESVQAYQPRRQRFTLRGGEFFFIDSTIRHAINIETHDESTTQILNAEFQAVTEETDLQKIQEASERPVAIVSMDNLKELSSQFRSFLELARPTVHLKDQGDLLLSAMRLLISALEDETRTEDDAWMVEAPLHILFRELGKRQPSYRLQGAKRHVEFANQFIESNFDRPISVQDVADFVEIHPAYLQRIYHSEQGYTLMNYVNQLRMKKARHLVGESTLSIEEIAELVGFKSRQSFSLAFHKYFKMNPQTFRRLSRKGELEE